VKYPTLTMNGVFQADAVVFNQDAQNLATFGQIENGADFRRARLSAKGSVNPITNYFFQMDFAFFGRPTFTDVWVEWTDIPLLGNVRAGQWKQPFSLEVVSSFRYTTFMERSLLFQPFTPFRHIAIGFYDHSEDLSTTWAASLMRTGQDQYGGSISTNGGNGFAGRITHLPYWDDCSNGRGYWHIGGAYYLNSPPRDTVRFRTIPEIFVGENGAGPVGTSGQAVPGALNGTPFFVDTLPIPGVEAVHTFGLESLTVFGPFSLQAEAMAAVVDQQANPTATLGGFYAQAGWFLTGEHRPYDRVAGAIDRVKPFEDFFWVGTDGGRCFGTGAWEVAARLSYLDVTDANINGGEITDVTGGVNWYMNAYTKAVFNYVHSWTDYRSTGISEASAFAFRVQVDF
jgi:phosphate-selective porin OprO and OprP